MEKIIYLNMTQHKLTREQIEDGAIEIIDGESKAQLMALLTLEELEASKQLKIRAKKIKDLLFAIVEEMGIDGEVRPILGSGHPSMQYFIVRELILEGIEPVYSFSKRKSTEMLNMITGEVEKKTIFVHEGFIEIE